MSEPPEVIDRDTAVPEHDRHGREGILTVIVDRLFEELARQYGGIPDTYVVLDIETSGLAPHYDKILQIGHCLVIDRVAVDRRSVLLDWTKARDRTKVYDDDIDKLKESIEVVRKAVTDKGKPFHTTWDRLRVEGEDPYKALREYAEWVREIVENGWFLVMHNGYHFDCKFLENAFKEYAPDLAPKGGVWFPDNAVFDTGVIMKAAQIDLVPRYQETLKQFSMRVTSERRKGVYWSLNEYSVPKLGLDKKYNLQAEKAHDAEYDCYVCHLLFEELRGLARIPLLKTKVV